MKTLFSIENRKNLTWFYPKICSYQDNHQLEISKALDGESDSSPLLLYIHIPFCASFCSYCACFKENFYAYTYEERKEFVNALIDELEYYFQSNYLHNYPVSYILFGGGTPSILENDLLQKLFETIHNHCNLKELKGISFEGNVISLKEEEKLRILKTYGVTRISFGLQTLQPEIRKMLNIRAKISDIYECVDAIHKVGIKQFNLDKIYNLPGESMDTLEYDLNHIYSELKPSLIQIYRFNLFANTRLANQIKQKCFYNPPSNEKEMMMFEYIEHSMKDNGYHNQLFINMYANSADIVDTGIELSIGNNKLYGSKMLGLGPGSMSYLSGYNYRNVCSIKDYIRFVKEKKTGIETGHAVNETELSHRVMAMFPNFMRIPKENVPNIEEIHNNIKVLIEKSYIAEKEKEYILTPKGKLWAGDISHFFYSPKEKERVKVSFINSVRHNKNPFNQDDMNV